MASHTVIRGDTAIRGEKPYRQSSIKKNRIPYRHSRPAAMGKDGPAKPGAGRGSLAQARRSLAQARPSPPGAGRGPPLRKPPCRSDTCSAPSARCRGKLRAPAKKTGGTFAAAATAAAAAEGGGGGGGGGCRAWLQEAQGVQQCAKPTHAPVRPCRAKYAGPVNPRVQPLCM